jgi:competence protein ComGB
MNIVKSRKVLKWRLDEQVILLRQLGGLLEKGYSLWHALEFLQFYLNETKKSQLKEAVEELKKGSSLHVVFTGLAFHSDLLGYLFYAEQHGNIAFALQQGSIILERKQKHLQKIKKALQYPLFLFLFLMGMVWLFNTVLLPQFSSLYHSMQMHSQFSDVTLSFLYGLPYVFVLIAVTLTIGIAVYFVYIRKLEPHQQMDIWMRIPFIRSFFLSLNSHYFAVQISSLLQGGLSIREVFVLMEKQPHHAFFKLEANQIKGLLANGERLESILAKRPYYEKELFYIITHGQASGNLGKELADYSDMVVEKVENRINKLIAIIQPLMFTLIGIIIVMMYLAMILPMFQMVNSI